MLVTDVNIQKWYWRKNLAFQLDGGQLYLSFLGFCYSLYYLETMEKQVFGGYISPLWHGS
jgi:hypothetical protein